MRYSEDPAKTLRAILEKLVGFNTVSSNSNLDLIDFIRDFLSSHNISSTLIPSTNHNKASLYATIGPKDAPGIGLSAHTDVVPVEGQNWSTDPFQLVEKNGKLYGRGTCDMKGFLACVLASVPELAKQDLKTPVHLLFSYDEEIGCVGVRPMIEKLGQDLTKPKMIIVGEPTDMSVVNAHKGSNAFITEVTGSEAHSSVLHLGVNAIMIGSLLIAKLREIGAELSKSQYEPNFTPPFTSVHVGKIAGGTALNIVPKSCEFVWEVRNIPGHNVEDVFDKFNNFAQNDIVPDMHKVSKDTSIETTLKNTVYAFQTSNNYVGEQLTSLTMRWAGQNRSQAVSYGTEAGFFEKADIPSIICGPGSIEQAHKPDEYVSLEQLEKCMKFLNEVTAYVSAN